MTAEDRPLEPSSRREQAEATYARLFGPRDQSIPEDDPELMEILRRFIFGDVFGTGVLDDQTRELITVTVLTCLQTLPQLRAHAAGALATGVTPVQLREAVYQLAPFIGFPRTLNAVSTIDAVFTEHGIALPLPERGTVDDDARYERGLALQTPLYGTEIKDDLADLPEPFNEAIPPVPDRVLFRRFLHPRRAHPGAAGTAGAVRAGSDRGYRSPAWPTRQGLPADGQLQDRGHRGAGPVLSVRRLSPSRGCDPRCAASVGVGRSYRRCLYSCFRRGDHGRRDSMAVNPDIKKRTSP